MGFLTQLTKTGLDIVTAPVAIVKDTVTMGGALTDEDEPATIKKLKRIVEDVESLPDSVDDGLI